MFNQTFSPVMFVCGGVVHTHDFMYIHIYCMFIFDFIIISIKYFYIIFTFSLLYIFLVTIQLVNLTKYSVFNKIYLILYGSTTYWHKWSRQAESNRWNHCRLTWTFQTGFPTSEQHDVPKSLSESRDSISSPTKQNPSSWPVNPFHLLSLHVIKP